MIKLYPSKEAVEAKLDPYSANRGEVTRPTT